MKNNRSRKNSINGKGLAIASAVGVCAVGAAVIAAYNSTMQRLIPTNGGTAEVNTWVFRDTEEASLPEDEPVAEISVGLAETSEEAAEAMTPVSVAAEETAEPVNKPIVAEIGNIMPVEGEVSHPFSNGELVKSETLGVWKSHDGCDILCELGTEVKSMSEGTVKEIRDDQLWGVCVVVEQSNGLEVRYCGLAKELNVKAGQDVSQGEIIGKTADTCQVEILQSPHLHLEVEQGGKLIDPMSVIDE